MMAGTGGGALMSSKTLSSARPEANDTSRPKWPFRGRKRPRNMQTYTSVEPPRGRREHFHLLSNPFRRNPLLWYGGKTRCRASFGKALKRAGTHSGPGKTFAHPVEDVAAHQHHRLALRHGVSLPHGELSHCRPEAVFRSDMG